MKKLLVTLTLLTLSALLPAGAAADYALRSVLVNTDTDTLTASLRADRACVLVTALYSGDGRTLGICAQTRDGTGGYNIQSVREAAFGCDLTEAVYGRAFLLDRTSLRPLCPRFDGVALLGRSRKNAALEVADTAVTITTDREALVDYMVVRADSVPLLTAPFWNGEATDGASAPLAAYGSLTTVLDALAADLDSADSGGGSVFDKYAVQPYKDRAAALIRSAAAGIGGVAGAGHGVPVSPEAPVTVDCARFPLAERTRYVFAAAAQSTAGGADAFRAAYPIVKTDTDPGAVTDTRTALHMDTRTVTDADGTARIQILDTFSGVASLTFNEYLYALDTAVSPPDLRQLDRGPARSGTDSGNPTDAGDSANSGGSTDGESPADSGGSTGGVVRDETRFRSLEDMVQIRSSDAVSLVTEAALVNQPTQVIAVRFDHAASGDFLTLSADICDRYGNTHSLPLTIRARVERVRTLDHLAEDGSPIYTLVPTPVIELSPSEWLAGQT